MYSDISGEFAGRLLLGMAVGAVSQIVSNVLNGSDDIFSGVAGAAVGGGILFATFGASGLMVKAAGVICGAIVNATLNEFERINKGEHSDFDRDLWLHESSVYLLSNLVQFKGGLLLKAGKTLILDSGVFTISDFLTNGNKEKLLIDVAKKYAEVRDYINYEVARRSILPRLGVN